MVEKNQSRKMDAEWYLRGINVIEENIRAKVSPAAYFRWLKDIFPIERIYYPGFGDDYILESAFKESEIFYLDNDQKTRLRRNLVIADLNEGYSPFKDGSFDAIFVQDIHLEEWDVEEFVRILKPHGIIIFSTDDCGIIKKDEVREPELQATPHFEELNLPFSYRYYSTFQKN